MLYDAIDTPLARRRLLALVTLSTIPLMLLGSGCSAPTEPQNAPAEAGGTAEASLTTAETDAATPSQGPAPEELEAFDPPPLDELVASKTWEDRPVVDPIALLYEEQKSEPQLVSVAEALAMKNDSDEDNAKILSALGRLPADDAEVNYDATIVQHLRGDINTTNPILQSSVSDFDVHGFMSLGLFGFDWNMDPFALADVVTRWRSSSDRLVDLVEIRDDLLWSDGTPVTAHDVVASFRIIMHPDIPIPAVKTGTDQLRAVHAYDDYTLAYFHKESLATNEWNINFPVIPAHKYVEQIFEVAEPDYSLQSSAYFAELENNPVNCGPYRVVRRTRGQEIVLERNENWYLVNGEQVRRKPYFQTVRFRVIEDTNTMLLALKKAEIEVAEITAEQWNTQTNDADFYRHNTKARDTEWVEFHFGWNMKAPFFADKRVRQAMGYAFDHNEMINTLFYGLYKPCAGILHPDNWAASKKNLQPYQQDLDKAEDLLDAAGWDDSDGDGIRDKEIDGQLVPFEFTILCTSNPTSIKVCELLKDSLDRIGVICNVKPTEWTVMQDTLQKHQFHAFVGGWGTGTDPFSLANIWGTGENRNYVQFSDPRVDELFELGKREFDREKRAAIYGEIHEILYEQQPYTWLYYRDAFFGFNKKLRGYRFSPRGPKNYNPGTGSFWSPVAGE